jgi:hypothetical protein
LRKAGCIVIGKCNTPAFGYTLFTKATLRPQPFRDVNPNTHLCSEPTFRGLSQPLEPCAVPRRVVWGQRGRSRSSHGEYGNRFGWGRQHSHPSSAVWGIRSPLLIVVTTLTARLWGGLKPTRGRIPYPSSVLQPWLHTSHVGPITRCVKDAAIYLQAHPACR